MRAAPAVSVRCAGGWPWRALRVLTPAAAAAALAMWGLGHAEGPPGVALAVFSLAAGVAWWLTPTPPVALSWDGQRWAVDGLTGPLDVMIDTGSWLLLRLRAQPAGQSRWVAVAGGEVGAAMHPLRAALYGHVGPDPATGARTAAAGGRKRPD